MKCARGRSGSAVALAALLGVCLASGAAKPAARPASPLLDAMDAELQRSMRGLATQPTPPYFLACTVTEREVVSIAAANGALRDSSHDRDRLLDVNVRVGDRTFDNTHRLQGESLSSSASGFSQPRSAPLDDDADALRAALWLEIDQQYKTAVEDLIQVRTNRAVSVAEEDTSADFSVEAPQQHVEPAARVELDTRRWEHRVRELSTAFTSSPEVYQSAVFFQAQAITHFMVSSEGSRLQHGGVHYRLGLYAETRADDGMELYRFESFDARSADRLPDDATVRQTVAAMVRDLQALRTAPVIEPFTGPAILEGRAAGVFFHEIFGHRIEGHRQKDQEEGQTFTKKVGQPVLPAFLDVVDDPTLPRVGDTDLNGTYAFDDEGVPAQRVAVVTNGVLKNFLMSRSPIAGFEHSNGHGRKSPGYRPVGRQGNLIVRATETVPEDKLREMLIAECRRQGKPFGLVLKDISGGFTFTGRGVPQAFKVEPLVVYRVWADGRADELVRGADLIGTPLVSFSQILAASDHTEVFNGYCGAESGWVPVSAVAPSILTAQIEIQKKEKSTNRPPLLPPPGKDVER
jgi:TldD protein